MTDDISILIVDGARATEVLAVVREAFAHRPVLDPPATALDETVESVREALDVHGGLLVEHQGAPVGALIFEAKGRLLGLRRVGVLAAVRGLGVAAQMASRARQIAQERGFRGLELEARVELPGTINFWRNLGYVEAERNGNRLTMLRMLPITEQLASAEDTRSFGEHLAERLGAGDLVILTGDLGAGKTTLTQGIGTGLGVRGAITSPTFVIARVHPSLSGGPSLVHVDAYRLGGSPELDDLDLDTDIDEAVTVVEWGEGLAESLSVDRLELRLQRSSAAEGEDSRTITVTPVGPRWRELDLGSVGSVTSG